MANDWEPQAEYIDSSLESIPVLRSHLEKWLEPLRWAYGHHSALDLADNYRDGRPNAGYHKITRRLGDTLQQIEGYLNTDQGEE